MTDNDRKPFWKTPMMWLVIGLPLASVVAGISLVVIAVRSGGADVVRDEVQRVSQIQTTNLGPDEQASTLGLSALLRTDEGVVHVIPVTGDFDRRAPLHVLAQHPTRATGDVEITLPPADGNWSADFALDDSHDWILQLTPADGSWRLHGRLPRQQHAVRLAPSLAQ